VKLPLNALRAFAAVYRQGGVRAAGRELEIAHSSVSKHVAELEEWLGVTLIDAAAGRRGINFTPQGEALGKATLAGFGDIERAVASVRESRSARSITIATTPSFAALWLLPRLSQLEQSHPHLQVSLMVEQKITDLDADGVDLSIRMGRGPWADVHCEALMDDALYPVMSPAFFAANGQPNRPEDLLGLRLLHDRDPHASWAQWKQTYGPESLDVLAGPRLASSDLVLRSAIQGHGVALARHQLARDDIQAGTLVRPIKDAAVSIRSAYWIVLPGNGRIRPAALTFIDWLKGQASRNAISS
jgi:Transcriptional regulator